MIWRNHRGEIVTPRGRFMKSLLCFFLGHDESLGCEVQYCGRSYTFRCGRCSKHVRRWWA